VRELLVDEQNACEPTRSGFPWICIATYSELRQQALVGGLEVQAVRSHLPGGPESYLIMHRRSPRHHSVTAGPMIVGLTGPRTLHDRRRDRSLTLPHRAGWPLDNDCLDRLTKVQREMLGLLRDRGPIVSLRFGGWAVQ
jgi:hypothetical protein